MLFGKELNHLEISKNHTILFNNDFGCNIGRVDFELDTLDQSFKGYAKRRDYNILHNYDVTFYHITSSLIFTLCSKYFINQNHLLSVNLIFLFPECWKEV